MNNLKLSLAPALVIASGFMSHAFAADEVLIDCPGLTAYPPSVQIGREADACVEVETDSGNVLSGQAIALGDKAKASYRNIAIGENASAITPDAISGGVIAIGRDSSATAHFTTALGANSIASENYAISIGPNSSASGSSAIATGYYANASASSAIAMGSRANAEELNAIAIGNRANAENADSVAVGSNAHAVGWRDIAIGAGANASSGTAIGSGASATYGTAVGNGAQSEDQSIAIGSSATATGLMSGAIGNSARTDEDYTISFGHYSEASNYRTTRRLTNISDGIHDYDAATVGQVKGWIANIDGGSGGGGVSAAYVDQAVSAAIASANEYTDTEIANIDLSGGGGGGGGVSTEYVDQSSASTLQSANDYTDVVAVETLNSANSYTDIRAQQAEERAVARSAAYTDARVNQLEKQLSSGIAAMAAIPDMPALPVGGFGLGIGTGHYNGENALGVRAGYAPRQNMTFQIGAGIPGNNSSGGAVISTGFTMTFR